jgi:Ca2+-transporting ATPase
VLLGIVGMEDPAREGVHEAIRCCRAAGVTVVMVTGDHAATAATLAGDTGIVDAGQEAGAIDGAELDRLLAAGSKESLLAARVFARVTPDQKLRLIDLYQDAGHVVAMTGDGVNDAPALKKADIGVAMGVRGTEVAREAASLVLLDDELRTTVVAIEQGRAIFANIRKFVVYLLSCNLSEMLVVALATLAGAPLPLLPLQILFLNLVTDVFPALALGVGAGAPGSMDKPPRPATERMLMPRHWVLIGLYGALLSLTVLAAMAAAIIFLGAGREEAVTVSFLTLALAQLWHVFNMRDDSSRWLRNEISGNLWIWVALPLCLVLVGAAVYLPPLADVLSLVPPGGPGWLLVLGASMAPLVLAPLLRPVARALGGRC